MAKNSLGTLRNKIEKDLMSQLKESGVSGNHYEDLVQDYLSLWDLKQELIEDIKDTGIKVSGMHGPKSNPSINDLHKTNDRMIKVLDALGLRASPIEPDEDEEKKKRTKNDLI